MTGGWESGYNKCRNGRWIVQARNGVLMPQIQIDDQVFKAAQRRATDSGYSSVDAYITDVVVHDLTELGDETPKLDHLFTPQVVAELRQISAKARAGGKTHTSEEVRQHFRKKSEAWEANHSG
jgi:hypothetical protein